MGLLEEAESDGSDRSDGSDSASAKLSARRTRRTHRKYACLGRGDLLQPRFEPTFSSVRIPRKLAGLGACRHLLLTLLCCGTTPILSGADIIWITENTDAGNPPSPDDIGWTDLLSSAATQ